MGELQATMPGQHRYVKWLIPAAMGAAGSMKFLRSEPSKHIAEKIFFPKKMPALKYATKRKTYPSRVATRDPSKRARTNGGKRYGPFKRYVAKKKKWTITSVPKGKSQKPYNAGGNVYSGGFLNPYGRKVGRYAWRMGQKGGFYSYEKGGVATTSQMALIGHSLLSRGEIFRCMAMSMVKAMIMKAGGHIRSWEDVIYNNTAQSAFTFEFSLKQNNEVNTLVVVDPSGAIGTTTKYSDLINLIITKFDSNALYIDPQVRLVSFRGIWTDVTSGSQDTKAEIPLEDAYVKISAKSILKLQNRSIGSVGNEAANDVDRVPLHGKSYFGFGNGLTFKGQQAYATGNRPYIADANCFIFHQETGLDLIEPPKPQSFQECKRSGKVLLEPGQIKTSILKLDQNYKINNLFQKVQKGSATNNFMKISLGKFAAYGLEKMLETLQVPEANSISIAYQLENKYGCMLIQKRNHFTAEQHFRP